MTDSDPAVFGSATLRVGTAEREQAAAALGEHFAAGRLEVDEYDERVARAYAAKTAAELAGLFTDLPRPAPASPPAPPVAPPVRWGARGLLPIVPIVALVAAVPLVATTHMFPFFFIPVVLFIVLGRRRGRGPGYRRRGYYYRM
jgi:hypothetical protein